MLGRKRRSFALPFPVPFAPYTLLLVPILRFIDNIALLLCVVCAQVKAERRSLVG